MKERNEVVPKEMCPMDWLAEQKGQIVGANIFLDETCVSRLTETCDTEKDLSSVDKMLQWSATEKYPETRLWLRRTNEYAIDSEMGCNVYFLLIEVEAADIEYKKCPPAPKENIFLTMEDRTTSLEG